MLRCLLNYKIVYIQSIIFHQKRNGKVITNDLEEKSFKITRKKCSTLHIET